MSKKLKIKFWRAEKALAMQILEQEGLPEKTGKGIVKITTSPDLWDNFVFLRGTTTECDYAVVRKYFTSNQDRDTYLKEITNAITTELFTSNGELKVGEMCEGMNKAFPGKWTLGLILAILPKEYRGRFIVVQEYNYSWTTFDEARPLPKRTEPKVEDNGGLITYTWEEK